MFLYRDKTRRGQDTSVNARKRLDMFIMTTTIVNNKGSIRQIRLDILHNVNVKYLEVPGG